LRGKVTITEGAVMLPIFWKDCLDWAVVLC